MNRIYVKGEVSNCKYHTSGHIYFSLKDESGTIACVMFAGQRGGLSFHMRDGQQVVVFGAVSIYERAGAYQLYAKEIRLDGEGVLYEKFQVLKKELEDVKRHREVTRQQRGKDHALTAAIVGYTNAGKSTLLNRLTGAGILAEDKLFATLDPTTRSFTLGDGQQILLTDTVGFINKLPHHLVEAFKSTLEEARYSDIVLHVVDCSNPQMDMHMHVVKETLRELGITDKTIVTVFNKTDRLEESGLPIPRDFSADYQVRISAKNGDGLKELEEILGNIIRSRRVYLEKTYSYSQAGKLQTIRKYGQLLSEEYTEEGIKVTAYVPAELFAGLYGDGSEEKE